MATATSSVHGDASGEVVALRFYDAVAGRDLAVGESVAFEPGGALGTSTDPLELTAGVVDVDIDAAGLARFSLVDLSALTESPDGDALT